MAIVLSVILFGLIFEYVNGFHDTANAIATVVSTRVLSPRQAIMLAAVCNLIGALWGTAVATTIGSGLVETDAVSLQTVLWCAVGRHRLESSDVVVGPAVELQPCLDRRPLRSDLGLRRRRLVGNPVVGSLSGRPRRGHVAKSDRAHDRLANLRADRRLSGHGTVAGPACGTGARAVLARCSAGCNCSARR